MKGRTVLIIGILFFVIGMILIIFSAEFDNKIVFSIGFFIMLGFGLGFILEGGNRINQEELIIKFRNLKNKKCLGFSGECEKIVSEREGFKLSFNEERVYCEECAERLDLWSRGVAINRLF